jgi:aminopeptidase N
MAKSLLLLIFTCLTVQIANAQRINYCSQSKINTYNKLHNKTRASVSDNLLMAKYDVNYYFLTIAAENYKVSISGNTVIQARVLANQLDTVCFELHQNYTIDSVIYNNTSIAFAHVLDIGYAYLPTPLSASSNFNINIYYHGTAPTGNQSAIDNGLNSKSSPSWGNRVTWSLSQPYSAYHWFPCKQFLRDKVDSSRVHIITSDSNKAGSNGLLVGIDTLGNGKVKYMWKNTNPIDYYLISIAVAKYIDYSYKTVLSNGDSLLVQNYVYNNPGTLTSFKTQIDFVGPMITYLDSLLIPYAFANEKYGHCMAPLSGGMEHQTMTTLGFFQFGIDAHELAHQWFGDAVTCNSWNDIMINEGFASYGEYLIRNRLVDYADAQSYMQDAHTNVMSVLDGSVYCNNDTSNARVFSSRLSYDKGNAVIHTLRFILGDSIFFKTLKTFLTQYKFSTASIPNLKTVAETVSGKNLSNYFNEWIYGEGFPIYSVEYNNNAGFLTLNITQTTSTNITPLFTTPLPITIKSAQGDTTIVFPINSASEYITIPFNKSISTMVIDSDNWIINKDGSIKANSTLMPASITELNTSKCLVFPNPVTGNILSIDCNGAQLKSMQLISVEGAIIKQVNFSNQLSTHGIANGTYFVKTITLNGTTQLHKISITQ